MLKSIQTEYKGYLFRSRLEARWAVFFDACGVDWEYEPEGYKLADGSLYLPDFLLHDVAGRSGENLFVEVKGNMTPADANKVIQFAGKKENGYGVENPVLVVGRIPPGENIDDVTHYIGDIGYRDFFGVNYFNFATVDGDYFAAHPGVNKLGKFELFGDDSGYLCDRDDGTTERAYRLARQARFEYGQTPRFWRYK